MVALVLWACHMQLLWAYVMQAKYIEAMHKAWLHTFT